MGCPSRPLPRVCLRRFFACCRCTGRDTRLVVCVQLLRPAVQNRVSFENLPYCNQTNDLPTYQTPFMTTPYYELTCVQEDEVTLVFPPDELNAMFVTTRATVSNQFYPPSTVVSRPPLVPVCHAHRFSLLSLRFLTQTVLLSSTSPVTLCHPAITAFMRPTSSCSR